ncbi:hypothetical protein niasHT_036921 [Heterodera trifolii]|uniref:BTB domain-containing protein n=1 Tax=Heterodera trifolii TaxID=157864 RepID=A0ABD2IPA8_9BILA
MSKPVLNWIKQMLSTGEYADVHFLVGDGDGKEVIPAHKLVLKLASDVFEAMFRFDSRNENSGNTSANCHVVEVPDVEAAAFKVMLSFIYADDLSGLNGDNAMAVLYAAKKYNIPDLVDPSLQIPFSELRNVFLAYAQARLFDLENYVNDCLAYIDKNADDLLKMEEFLQIDQKLLCEILERDQLQIIEEILIWETNRRQMLGPALFKIRFPLFSEEEFSEKIVPSVILSTNKVVGIEQYHTNPNFCVISDGLLCPLQFPSHERIKAFGTLLMTIEKVSEFVKELVESFRHSETVYINELPWKILAKIKTKKGSTDNEKCLGIYLWCTASEKDTNWRCYIHSATFRIYSQKNGAENSVGTFCNYVLDNKLTNMGFTNFIAFAELMNPSNGFYNREEDKVTLAIDVTVKNEKIYKFNLDQSKSNGTLSLDIEKVSEFAREIIGSERKSETVTYIKGFLWKLWAKINQWPESTDKKKSLGIYLFCAAPKEAENWSYECSALIRTVSQKDNVADLRREFNGKILKNKRQGLGFNFFFIGCIDGPEKWVLQQRRGQNDLGYRFQRERSKNGKRRIWTSLRDEFIRIATSHTYERDPSRVIAQKFTTATKRRTVETMEAPSVMRAAASQSICWPALSKLS